MRPATTFTVRHGGVEYALRLRLCPDGFISGYERAAVDQVLGDHVDRFGRPVNLMHDPARADRFFALVLDVAEAPGASEWRSHDGTPLPWRCWLEVDTDVLVAIFDSFFLSIVPKLKTSPGSNWHTAAAQIIGKAYPSEETMSSGTSVPAPHPAPVRPSGSSARDHDTTSPASSF